MNGPTRCELEIKGRIESLSLKPGDVVIATLDAEQQTRETGLDIGGQLETYFAERLGFHVWVLVVNGVTLSKATP